MDTTTTFPITSDLANVFSGPPSATLTWEALENRPMRSSYLQSDKFSSPDCFYEMRLYFSSIYVSYYDDLSGQYNNDNFDNRGFVFLYASLIDASKAKLHLHYRLSVLNSRGEKCNTQEGREFVRYTDSQLIAVITINREFLDDKIFVIDGKVTVFCEIFELNEPKVAETYNADCLISLSSNMKNLLESGKDSDVVLVASEVELKAHKIILSASSPVFEAMFDYEETKEAKEGKVVIPDMAADILREMLRYIYTGQVLGMQVYAHELLFAAEKYQLEGLKRYCVTYLSSSLTIENVASLLQIAELFNITQLKDTCLKFITDVADDIDADTFKAIISISNTAFELFKLQANRIHKINANPPFIPVYRTF